jgi:hypothetical protein
VSFDTSISVATNLAFAAGSKSLISASATFRASDVYVTSTKAIAAIDLRKINFVLQLS